MADNSKLACATKALSFVTRGMSIGLGTGSTSEIFIEMLGKKNKEDDMDLTCIATSRASEEQARKLGLKTAEFSNIDSLDAAFDGADQVDPKCNLIKGLGGALLREKIVAAASDRLVIIADEPKLLSGLGATVPLPVVR